MSIRKSLLPPLFAFAAAIASCAMSEHGQDPVAGAPEAPGANAEADAVTLEMIMSDPDWMGNGPEGEYWADDGQSVYYQRKKVGSEERELIQVDLRGQVIRVVSDEERPFIDVRGGDYNSDYSRKVYVRGGNLFIKNLADGTITQLTKTSESISSPEFMHGDQRLVFRRNGNLIIRDLATGVETQPADLRAQDDPDEKKDEKKKEDYLADQQERLFETIRQGKERREEAEQRRKREREADATTLKPWYLGGGIEIRGTDLSPDGRWMLVRTAKTGARSGRGDVMPQFITEDGYVATRSVRDKVGTSEVVGESLILLDLENRTRHDLDLSVLPGISDDPFAKQEVEENEQDAEDEDEGDDASDEDGRNEDESAVTEEGQPPEPSIEETQQKKKDEAKEEEPKPRPVSIRGITWNEDGTAVLLQVYSEDNKDRWIASVDLAEPKLLPQHHLHDPAWIGWGSSTMGWLADGRTFYFVSEESGYAHLYTKAIDEQVSRQITWGDYEVSDVRHGRDRTRLFYTANALHPGIYEAWMIDPVTADTTQLTSLAGRADWTLSPDEKSLLISFSTRTRPPELLVQSIDPPSMPWPITRTVSEAFTSLPWIEPEIVEIPSSESDQPIYSRLYLPPEEAEGLRPAVVFIHGAGYLQNAHYGWSSYFREFMFHTLLARRGYVVLDMDYRASAGYGRDWRTAIYGRMGEPELVDLRDGVNWLAANHRVDPERVGAYGGSYGGFLTLMAMFREPDLFACGAALRPVTDWAHYNHGYTANILDTPKIAPEAYERSSPIEFADGLQKPLLICHGMLDDNVFVLDTVRLAQRLIELRKENWEVALYPVESHGFREPTSWLDEYRRILKLFETHLRN